MIGGIADAGVAAPDGQAIPDSTLSLVLSRLDPAGRRTVLDLHRLYRDDLRLLAQRPPSPETAGLVDSVAAQFVADVARLLWAMGEHGEALGLVQRFLTLRAHEHEDEYFPVLTHLMARGLIRPGAIAWHAARLARWRRFGRWDAWRAAGVRHWDGRPLDGRSILVVHDEGLGDRIWHARYLRWLADELGGRVVVEAGPHLARLLRRTPGVSATIAEAPRSPGRGFADFWVLPTGLPALYGETHETIPTAPYIVPDPGLVARWRPYVAGGRVTVGLNWAGDPASCDAPTRDIPLAAFAPLARVSGIRWIGLQKCLSIRAGWTRPADGGHENDPAPPGMELVRLGQKFADYANTAAVVAQLDLVITSDTSVAHLGGALGKPTWLLLHAEHSYLWGDARYIDVEAHAPSVWYPSMRVFRALPGEDWGPVMARVANELAKLVAERGAT